MFSIFNRKSKDSIEVSELNALIDKINLIDIRETYEFQQGHIKTAKNIPMDELLTNPEKYLSKDKKYYLICQSGMRSSRAVSVLKKAGYEVINVKGGMNLYCGI